MFALSVVDCILGENGLRQTQGVCAVDVAQGVCLQSPNDTSSCRSAKRWKDSKKELTRDAVSITDDYREVLSSRAPSNIKIDGWYTERGDDIEANRVLEAEEFHIRARVVTVRRDVSRAGRVTQCTYS